MNDKTPADLVLRVGQFEAMNGFAAERQFVERFWRFGGASVLASRNFKLSNFSFHDYFLTRDWF